MFQPSPAAADAHLRGVLSAAAAAGVMSPVPDLDTLIHAGEGLGRVVQQFRHRAALHWGQWQGRRPDLKSRRSSEGATRRQPIDRSQATPKPCNAAGSVSEAAPWFEVYRTEFFRMMAFGEHETMDHPVACELGRVACRTQGWRGKEWHRCPTQQHHRLACCTGIAVAWDGVVCSAGPPVCALKLLSKPKHAANPCCTPLALI